MNTSETNKIFRKSIIKGFFEPELIKLDFKTSNVQHPEIMDKGLMQSDLLHIFFDVETGSDYPDGDEWFMVEYFFPFSLTLPDSLKGSDYFTKISGEQENSNFWHHRELVRYKYGKSKKLNESLQFVKVKYEELLSILKKIEKTEPS